MVIPSRRICVGAALICLGLAATLTVWAERGRPKKKSRQERHEQALHDFSLHAEQILKQNCSRCHGPERQEAGLRLDTLAATRRGSNGGSVVIPKDSAKSLLIAVIGDTDSEAKMPPSGKRLDEAQVTALKAWIDAGAPLLSEEVDGDEPSPRDHWAFRPVVAPPVPDAGAGWARNPIDAFLASQMKAGVTPAPLIGRELLLRRLAIDLVGLPPARDELHAFLAQPPESAYAQAVERFLASPAYGERWGRHWMDIWRFSDPDGRKAKADIWWGNEHIWRWRDWIVQSLNSDKGYDRMVVEMLAGDELAPDNFQALAATGFLVRNWFKLDRNIWLNNTVEHTGKAFLGLTLACARCHDHKFDPVSQKDYYGFRAFFEPHDVRTDPLPDKLAGSVARAFDAKPEELTWIFVRGDPKTPDTTGPIPPAVPASLGGPELQIVPVDEGKSTGRRLALAKWITDRRNPLTARVAVNHVWARHFGRPLVANVADFGVRTAAPAQQALLDWLAADFMEHGWSMKRLHRLIVTSAAYQMGPAPTESSSDVDTLCWRTGARRMEAEVVRDSLLYLAGVLDPMAGGPPLDHARGEDTARRSLYYRYSREDKMEFLTAFDAPGVEECYRRQESIVPQQALALENSEFVWDKARRIARLLEADVGTAPAPFVTAAFEHVLGRTPATAEREACERFLVRQELLLADSINLTPFPLPPAPPAPPDAAFRKRVPGLPLILAKAQPLPPVAPAREPAGRAREYLIHVLLNHNDFITVR